MNVEFYYEFVNKRHVILTRNGENNRERVREGERKTMSERERPPSRCNGLVCPF